MQVFKDINGRLIRLTAERVEHIALKHSEVMEMLGKVESVLSSPDIVTPDPAPKVFRYYKWFDDTPKGPKYFVVVAKITESDGWVLTGWLTDRVR